MAERCESGSFCLRATLKNRASTPLLPSAVAQEGDGILAVEGILNRV